MENLSFFPIQSQLQLPLLDIFLSSIAILSNFHETTLLTKNTQVGVTKD
jgi:hypothetical protein